MSMDIIYNIIFMIIGAVALLWISLYGWGNTLYVVMKNWRLAVFFIFCAAGGVLAATHSSDISATLQGRLKVNQKHAEATISHCKSFLTAYSGREDGLLKEPLKAGFIKISNDTSDYWKSHYLEVCAQAFGMNYWRHDITVNGQSGGRVLCEIYRKENFKSGKIQSWCGTVFAHDPKS